ncbi:hypothetical protein ACFZCU_47295 [Streptomyces canus]|uniref:hypothetical protein n=1 Tax=Streptomyces canus TaxID=58343 RepID=UPI0036EB9C17
MPAGRARVQLNAGVGPYGSSVTRAAGPAPTRHPVAGIASTTDPAVAAAKTGRATGGWYGVSVVGYDDMLSRLSSFNLTTVSQGAQEQARHAVTAAVESLDEDRTERG